MIGKISDNLDMRNAVAKLKHEIYNRDIASVNKYNKDQDEYRNNAVRYDRALAAFTDMNEHLGDLITNTNPPSVERVNKKSKEGQYANIIFGDNEISVFTNEKGEINKLKMGDIHHRDSVVIYTPFMAQYEIANDTPEKHVTAHPKSERRPFEDYSFTKMCQCVYKVLPELRPKTNQA